MTFQAKVKSCFTKNISPPQLSLLVQNYHLLYKNFSSITILNHLVLNHKLVKEKKKHTNTTHAGHNKIS